jgi:hypothetical protein
MDIDAVANIMDEVLKGLLTEKIYPYGRQGLFGNKVASGSLRASIEVVPTSVEGKVIFQLFANDYFQWVQSGRRPNDTPGKGVPIDAILDWMGERGIFATDRTNEQYKALQSQVSTAYIINKSRIKKGKHPLPMNVLLKWIKDKNVKFNIDLQKGMAFAIQKNIKKFGIAPANIEDKLYEQLAENTKFTDALGQYTFEQYIDKINYIFIETKTT